VNDSPIIDCLNKIVPLAPDEIGQFEAITTMEVLPKGTCLIEEEKANHKLAFLNNGYLRKFYVDDGIEITDAFYFEGDFCGDLPSIIGKTKPTSSIIAMEETTVVTFAYKEFHRLRGKNPKFERIYSYLLEQTFLRFYQRATVFIRLSPIDRYDQLMETHPEILQKATQYHIASYLGISYQHLSRLRARK
jgi:CRP-like cAMP-binding protein